MERLSDEAVGKDLLRRVESRRDVVVELAREPDLVLRRAELLHQRADVLVRLEVRVVLRQSEQPRESLGQLILARGGVGDALSGHGAVSRLDDFLQSVLLELHLTLHRRDQIGDQVVAALQLDVDLFPGVRDLVLERDQVVVAPDRPDRRDEREHDQEQKTASECGHLQSTPLAHLRICLREVRLRAPRCSIPDGGARQDLDGGARPSRHLLFPDSFRLEAAVADRLGPRPQRRVEPRPETKRRRPGSGSSR